jgi:glycosyltransferase A (GT-A) superfamily protein (DUF2064 family)
MKTNSSIYLISNSPAFNKDTVSEFESFCRDDSLLLYSSLIENHKEIFDRLPKTINVIYCIDNNDKDFLPESFKDNNLPVIFYNTADKKSLLKSLSDKYFNESDNNLLIFTDSIGITPEDIQKVFNLLQIEDEVIVLGKTNKSNIAFIGFNSFNKDLFLDLAWNNLSSDYLIEKVNKHDNLIHILGNFITVNSIEDFKYLYAELSKKESLAYCSQNMHEKFTHLFIEYKDLLK